MNGNLSGDGKVYHWVGSPPLSTIVGNNILPAIHIAVVRDQCPSPFYKVSYVSSDQDKPEEKLISIKTAICVCILKFVFAFYFSLWS